MTHDVKLREKEIELLLKQKNEGALSYLYDKYAPLVYGIIQKEVTDRKLASEILKSTFINIFDECKNLDCVKQSLFIWLLLLTQKTASGGFDVNIDLKAVLMPEKISEINVVQESTNYSTNCNSSSPYLAFYKTN